MHTEYAVSIVRTNQAPERRLCTSEDGLRIAAYDLIRSEGGYIPNPSHHALIKAVGKARSRADHHGFAYLRYRNGGMTIRPKTP